MKSNNIQMKCPGCGYEGEKGIKNRFCTSLDKQVKEKILSGEFFEWECPGCNARYFVKTPFLYNDDENRFMVYYIPDFKDRSYKVPTVIKTLKEYDTSVSSLRIAANFVDFIEKIRIFESELDDRVIEAVKLLYTNMYEQDTSKKIFNIIFESFQNKELHFGVYLKDEDFEAVLPESVYEQAIVDFLPFFGLEPDDEFIVVDQEWLYDVLTAKK